MYSPPKRSQCEPFIQLRLLTATYWLSLNEKGFDTLGLPIDENPVMTNRGYPPCRRSGPLVPGMPSTLEPVVRVDVDILGAKPLAREPEIGIEQHIAGDRVGRADGGALNAARRAARLPARQRISARLPQRGRIEQVARRNRVARKDRARALRGCSSP